MFWVESCNPLLEYGAHSSNVAHEAIHLCHALLQMCSFCHLHAQQQLNLQSMTHRRNAAGLMSMTTLLPEGRQVLAQRRMSGRVAKVFTSTRSEYLQVGSTYAYIIHSMTVFGDYCALHRTCTDSIEANQGTTTTRA